MIPFQQLAAFPQMSFPQQNGPFAYVTQTGSGTYNNFRGNQFKPKGKGKKFYSGSQQYFQQPSVHVSQSLQQPIQQQSSFQ